MNFSVILLIFLSISNIEPTPTQRGLGRRGHHREDFTKDPSGNKLTILDEREPKEAGCNLLQEEQEQDQRQVVKGLLRQLRQLGRWRVKVKLKRARENDERETRGQNWAGVELRDSRAGLHHDNSHGTLISKGW